MSAEPKRLSDDPEVPEDLRVALETEARQTPAYDVNQGWERLSTASAARKVAAADRQPIPPFLTLGRYTLYGEIGAGGMATVHYARISGAGGFGRTVAVKRLHPQLAKDAEFVAMFLDEARLAARVKHPNVVPTLDVVTEGSELFVVMEYIHGEPLSKLIRTALARGERIPPPIVASIMAGVLHGLHAAHEAKSEDGEPLKIVHRDVSPQNILVGSDGVARVLDFGVAKAVGRLHTTREGQLKGKLAYMPPEQLAGEAMTRQADVYAASVVFWEALTQQRLFAGETEAATLTRILNAKVLPPSAIVSDVAPAYDRIVLRGLSRDPKERYATARDMAIALEKEAAIAPASEVAAWVEGVASAELHERDELVAAIEREGSGRDEAKKAIGDIVTPPKPATTAKVVEELPAAAPSTPAVPDTASRSRWPFAVGAGLLVLLAIGTAYVLGGRTTAPSAPLPTATTSAPATVSAEPTKAIAPAASSVPTSIATPSSTASTPTLVHTTTHPSATPPTVKSAASASASAAPTAPIAPTANPCDPPYTTDANGHRHYKPNCFPQ